MRSSLARGRTTGGLVLCAALAHVLAAGADALTTGSDAVLHYGRAEVDAAFARGAVLFDGGGRNYMVHASRRDASGMAEVHADDTDIIHVLGGSATLVTGGTVESPSQSGPGEVRGRSIAGGDTRRIAAGDVLVVPNGTPHWFREVDGVLTYFVVKVRR